MVGILLYRGGKADIYGRYDYSIEDVKQVSM